MKLTARGQWNKVYHETGNAPRLKESVSAPDVSTRENGTALAQAMFQHPDQIDTIEAYQRHQLVKNLNAASQDPPRCLEAAETALALADLQKPNSPMRRRLEIFARAQKINSSLQSNADRPKSDAVIHVGKICFDDSPQETEVFKQLFDIINRDRRGFGKWLWYLGDGTTLDTNALSQVQRTDITQPERIKATQWTIQNVPITDHETLRTYMLGKSEDASNRAFYPVFQQRGKEAGKVVGCMSFGGSGEEREMHWWIGKQYRGQGIMKEAHQRAAEYLFNEGVRTLSSSAEVENISSRAALRKLYQPAEERSSISPLQPVWRAAWKNDKLLSTDIEYSLALKKANHEKKAPTVKDLAKHLNVFTSSKNGHGR